jgi:hypothetical protein
LNGTQQLSCGTSYLLCNRRYMALFARCRWREARQDLSKAAELEAQRGHVNALVLNDLGNAEGAVGDWHAAMRHFSEVRALL